MEKWQSELDALINDTMAMVAAAQSAGSVSRRSVAQHLSLPERSVPIAMPPSTITVCDAEPSGK
jgi:hypothetical protein